MNECLPSKLAVLLGSDYRWFCCIGSFASEKLSSCYKNLCLRGLLHLYVFLIRLSGLHCLGLTPHIIILAQMCVSGMSVSFTHSKHEVLEWLTEKPQVPYVHLFYFSVHPSTAGGSQQQMIVFSCVFS